MKLFERIITIFILASTILCLAFTQQASALMINYFGINPQNFGTFSFGVTIQFDINNFTGETWSGFDIELDLDSSINANFTNYSGPGTVNFSPTVINVRDLVIPDNEMLSIMVTYENVASLNETFGIPIVGVDQEPPPGGIPEPSMLFLLGSGLVGIGVFRKKFKK